MDNQNIALEVRNLSVSYDTKVVLWNVNIALPKGQLIAILGPNGAGKSTLLKSILGFVKPLSGNVSFPGFVNMNQKSKNFIAYIPQSGSVDWDFPATVLDVVLMGTYGRLGWFKRPSKSDVEKSYETIKKVGLEGYEKTQIKQLSGGQQQRVFLARALVQNADMYFLDEPFKGVDVQTEQTIVALLQELKNQGKTIIVVHHALHTVKEYFDYVVMVNKKIIGDGPVSTTFHDESIKATYNHTALLMGSEV